MSGKKEKRRVLQYHVMDLPSQGVDWEGTVSMEELEIEDDDEYERVSGINIRDHIVEIEVSTPVTVAHYVGAWKGSIYGYSHSTDDHAVARLQMKEDDHFIDGLEFAGAHAISGNGMGPAVTNGRAAAKAVIDDVEKKRSEAAGSGKKRDRFPSGIAAKLSKNA